MLPSVSIQEVASAMTVPLTRAVARPDLETTDLPILGPRSLLRKVILAVVSFGWFGDV